MPNLGPAELFVIFIVALLVFGPNKLPEIGRQVGKAIREFRRVQGSLNDEFREAFGDQPPRPSPPAATSAPSPAAPAPTAPATPPAPAPEKQPAPDTAEGATPGTDAR